MEIRQTSRIVLNAALLGLVMLLWGRCYQHLFFEGPYRAFFLDQQLFGGVQRALSSLSWLDFVNSPKTDESILLYTRIIAVLWLLASFVFLFYQKIPKAWLWAAALITSASLLFYAAADYLDKGYQLAQWIEYAAQIVMPVLFVLLLQKIAVTTWLGIAKTAIALTFLGHGLYALGYFPLPGNFVYMTTQVLGVTDAAAREILFVAGILDIAAALLLFAPSIDKYALLYCIAWGFLTALARPVAYILPNHLLGLTVHQTAFEFFVRFPHFILPFCTYLVLLKREVNPTTQKPPQAAPNIVARTK